jgi:hypothetical protein
MRYVFWFIICAVFADALANNTRAVVGYEGTIGALLYGGVNGLGVALATGPRLSWPLLSRFLVGVGWTILLMAFYSLTFASTGNRTRNDVLFWGLIFGLPAALVCVLRGVSMMFAPRRPSSKA